MKKLIGTSLCVALALVLGCNEHKSTGGPGATGSQNKGPKESTRSTTGDTTRSTTGDTTRGTTGDTTRDTSAKENTFTITAPSLTTDLKQGQAKEVTISIHRGKEFKQNIKLTLSSEGKGITIRPETAELKASDNAGALKFTIEASKDAAIGEHKVTVKATPETGPPAETTFNVKVTGP